MQTNKIKLTEHFSLREFQCPCCGTVKLKPRLLRALELLRGGWGKLIIVTSGYRCEAHNVKVGGAVRSRHRLGGAADIAMPAALQDTFCNLAVRCGFVKTILYPDRHFVHLEV